MGSRVSIVQPFLVLAAVLAGVTAQAADDFPKPYSPPCVERENVFAFAERPSVKLVAKDRHEISFAVKGLCDVTVSIVDPDSKKEFVEGRGTVVRHLASGVLGANAPAPFQKNSLKQTIVWDGKDDLGTYVKDPEALRVRVSLGLKPEFDRRLGGTSPKNVPGYVWGVTVAEDAAYVFTLGHGTFGHFGVRAFDHDGKYLRSLVPPPAGMAESKLKGMGYVEYEKGRRAVHAPFVNDTVCYSAQIVSSVTGKGCANSQPVKAGGRLFFCNFGKGGWGTFQAKLEWSGDSALKLHYIHDDGATDVRGLDGVPIQGGGGTYTNMATSPDGRTIYMTATAVCNYVTIPPMVMRVTLEGEISSDVFVGDPKEVGSDNAHLNMPFGIACDSKERVYVCDGFNNRIQIFSSKGEWLKTLPVKSPLLVCVHRKTGALYVLHEFRLRGKTSSRLTKFRSFDSLEEEWHMDDFGGAVMALDSWTEKPRLWVAGEHTSITRLPSHPRGEAGLRVYEEDGKALRRIVDFDEEARKEAADSYMGRWSGISCAAKVVCDPTRERVYFNNSEVLDLKSGKLLHSVVFPGRIDDFTFDKRGYMHAHLDPGFYQPGVGRLDPDQSTPDGDRRYRNRYRLKECPYDYGIEAPGWVGIIPVKDQPGAKFFQDGIGVNMRGDVAEICNIYYVPRMDNMTLQAGWGGNTREGCAPNSYANFLRRVQQTEQRGETVYSIRRVPGFPLCGGTIWTFDRSGELRQECAVMGGQVINGVGMDEDGHLYYVAGKVGNTRMIDGKPFLQNRYGRFGVEGRAKAGWSGDHPFTGTLIRTAGERTKLFLKNAPVPMDKAPERSLDLDGGWVEGAEWMYAGASPTVAHACTCPTMRAHLDWYRRSFVAEAYRHSFGVLDTAGNLVMHLGTYGNFDSGNGAQSKIPVGGDNIAVFMPRMISGTDNFLCFDDWGERLVVLRIGYHAEETTAVR